MNARSLDLALRALPRRLQVRARHPDGVALLVLLVSSVSLGLLIVDALHALTETIELGGWETWLAVDDGRLTTLLMAGLAAGAGGVAIRHAFRAGSDVAHRPWRGVWVVFGLGCLVLGGLDVADIELSAGEAALPGLVLLVTGAVIASRLRGNGRVSWLMAAGLLLVVLSPVAGAIEIELVTNPHNYTPGAPGEPYPFIHSAWVRLWWVSRFQELSELAAMACFLLALSQRADKVRPPNRLPPCDTTSD